MKLHLTDPRFPTMNGDTSSPMEIESEIIMEDAALLKTLVWFSLAIPFVLLTLGVMLKLQD